MVTRPVGVSRAALSGAALAIAVLLVAGGSARAQQVTTHLEPSLVPVGGTVDLTIEVEADDLAARVDEPALPELSAEVAVVARGREARVEMRGLDVRRSTVFRYTLRGIAPGTVRIDPIGIRVGERTLHTQPMVLLVVGELGPAETRRAPDGAPPIFVSARVDRQRAWTGQQVTLTFSFYHDPSSPLAESPDYDPPQTPGFWRVELSDEPEITSERIGDRTYQVQRFRYALFPLQAGVAEIGPARVRVVQPDAERWWEPGRPRVLATDPLTITVDELPEGAPEGFGGAVGRYSLSGELPATQATAGSPIELALTVRGSGNPATVDAPELPGWPDIDVGMPSVETESAVEGSRLEGRATFRWILVPRTDGILDLGAARLPYFDPDRGAYAVDTLRLGELRIRPGTVAAMAADSEPRGPTLWEPRAPRAPGPHGLADAPLYWAALAGPWLAWLALLAWARRPRRQPSVRRAAVGILATARRDVAARGSEAAPEAVRTVERALEIRYGVSLAGLASLERRRRLEGCGAPPEVVDGSEAARAALEGARFGGAGLDLAVGELERLERAIDTPGSRRAAGTPGAIALALALTIGAPGAGLAQPSRDTALRQSAGATPANATEAWRESNEAYQRGDMAAAARGFEALARRHEDPRLEANLAAALWRQGRRGEALARYRSALALDPRDPAIRRDEQQLWNELGRPPRVEQPARALAAVRLDELLLLLLAASWVAAGVAAVARTRKVARPLVAAGTAVVIALAVTAALHAMTVERPRRAIAAAGAELRAVPGGDPIGSLPEGTVVRVLERAADGWRVRVAGLPAGWVAPDRIAPLD
jgi:tetratricopeptide (TPR) repeat protein